eukprot:7946393-Alexandrium_andersonii.AAC.1
MWRQPLVSGAVLERRHHLDLRERRLASVASQQPEPGQRLRVAPPDVVGQLRRHRRRPIIQ